MRRFPFKKVSKICIAKDSSPVDGQSYELCSDMIDVVIDVSCIYGCVSVSLTAGAPGSISLTLNC